MKKTIADKECSDLGISDGLVEVESTKLAEQNIMPDYLDQINYPNDYAPDIEAMFHKRLLRQLRPIKKLKS